MTDKTIDPNMGTRPGLSIMNSLTGRLEKFEPVAAPVVNIYTCGVTVYDDCHIGHARSLYIFDVIRKYLAYSGYKVNFVRNITDIDDKIINRANELHMDWAELVDKYIKNYKEDLKALGVGPGSADPDAEEPRATRCIGDIINYIKALIDKGYGYPTATGVYFSVRKFGAYGKLSGQMVDDMLTGVRKNPDETKADPLDFALWKASKPGEPSWPSPWGDGRPGWHIECSVMSTKYLKTDTLDIHAGGRDLIFPHHENEIAQSEAKSGKQFAKYWMHNGLLTIDGQKMSKSSGNFITIRDFLARYRDPDYLKLFFLSAHYSSPIDYTDSRIEECRKEKERFRTLFRQLDRILAGHTPGENGKPPEEFERFRIKFESAMNEDFNTSLALAELFEAVTFVNKKIYSKDSFTSQEKDGLSAMRSSILILTGILGLDFSGDPRERADKGMIEKLLDDRRSARNAGDYKKADEIRKKLSDMGIILKDTKEGTEWRSAE